MIIIKITTFVLNNKDLSLKIYHKLSDNKTKIF